MNKTINVNLAGYFFHVDEEAYRLLSAYLNQLKTAFDKTAGREEILSDIEARIAELFQNIKKQDNQVIGTDDVKAIIETLGQPEDFAPDIEEDENQKEFQTIRRKLFRDGEDKYIGGVASGLAHYFKIETAWLRLIWLLLFLFSGGSFLLIYLLLWILVPEARTTAEKLQMRGEPVNIATIEKKIKSEFEDLSSRVKEAIDYENNAQGLKKKSKILFTILERIFVGLFSLIGGVIGFILAFAAGIALLVTLVIFVVTALIGVTTFLPDQIIQYTTQIDVPYWVFFTLIAITLTVPLLFIMLIGIRLIAPKSRLLKGVVLLSLFGLWLIAVVSVGVIAIHELKSHAFKVTTTTTQQLDLQKTDTLHLNLGSPMQFKDRLLDNDDFDLIRDNQNNDWVYTNEVQLKFEPSEDQLLRLKIEKEASGKNFANAKTHAQSIVYAFDIEDNQIKLNNYLISPAKTKFRDQEITLTLYLPEGQNIRIDNALANLLAANINNDQDWYRRKIAGHFWQQRDNRLNCLDCSTDEDN